MEDEEDLDILDIETVEGKDKVHLRSKIKQQDWHTFTAFLFDLVKITV
jgi:hypothetical protein